MPRKSHRDRNAVARAVRHHRPRVNFPVTMHTTCVCVRVYVCVCLFARLTYDGCAFCPLPLPVCLFSFFVWLFVFYENAARRELTTTTSCFHAFTPLVARRSVRHPVLFLLLFGLCFIFCARAPVLSFALNSRVKI